MDEGSVFRQSTKGKPEVWSIDATGREQKPTRFIAESSWKQTTERKELLRAIRVWLND